MIELLTLGITEVHPGQGDFYVVVLNILTKSFSCLMLTKEAIIPEGEPPLWDIGWVTSCERLDDSTAGRRIKVPTGVVKLVRNELMNLGRWLNALSITADQFFQNPNEDFTVARVSRLHEIFVKNGVNGGNATYRLRLDLDRVQSHHQPNELLNKDFRWVKYWNWTEQNGAVEDRIAHYTNLLNRRGKTLYLILYRHRFANGPQIWISGMHWI